MLAQRGPFGGGALRGLLAIAVGLAVFAGWQGHLESADEPKDQSLSAFMRKKLVSSSQILEGLTTEDAALIREGASALLEMSKAEKWNVLADADYRDFNQEFRSAVRKLDEAAAKGNFDNATLQWFGAVKSCVECHKYVRAHRPTTKP